MPETPNQIMFVLSIAVFMWCMSYWFTMWMVGRRETGHNRLCRKLLREVGALPAGERYPHVEKLIAHDEVDGSQATINALSSLVEQECLRGCEVRWHLDGGARFYADASFGATGKRYVND